MYLSQEQKQAKLKNAEEELRRERIKQTRLQASFSSRTQCAQYRELLSEQRRQQEKEQKLKIKADCQAQIQLLLAMKEEAQRMTGEAHRKAQIEKQRAEEEMRAKMERIQNFNSTAGLRSKEAADRFRKEQEEAQREQRLLRERQHQTREEENRMQVRVKNRAHEVAEKERAHQAWLEKTRPPPPLESEIHAFKNSRENQIRKIEEFKNTTFHNTQIVRHETAEGEKNAAERAVEEAEKARLREINKENYNSKNRVRASQKGVKAMGLERVTQETDQILQELEKLQKAEGMLRVKEKPKTRQQMQRQSEQKQSMIQRKFEEEFDLCGIEEPTKPVTRKEEKQTKLKITNKERKQEQRKKGEEGRRLPPPHSLEARYDEPPKVTLSIKEEGAQSQGQSERASDASARLQQSVSIKVPSVQGAADEIDDYPTPLSVKSEARRESESKKEEEDDSEEAHQEVRNKMEGTLSNRFRRQIVSHDPPHPQFDSGVVRQPIMTPAFQGENSIKPWDTVQFQQIYPPAPAIQYSPLRDRMSDDTARVKKTEIVESSRVVVPSPPSLINTQQIKDFVEQNREYLPDNMSKSPQSLSSMPYSSSLGTSSKYYSSLNNSRPRVHNYTIKEEDSKFSDTSLQTKHDVSPLQPAVKEDISSVTTSQLIDNMSLSKLCPADTDEPKEDTARSIPKPKRTSTLSESLASVTGVKPARYIQHKQPSQREIPRRSDDLLNEFLAQRQSTERNEKDQIEIQKLGSGRSEEGVVQIDPFKRKQSDEPKEQRKLPHRPTIIELDKKVSPKSEDQERRITPLSKAQLEKYMYANVEESKELSTPGRITNPDNLSESDAVELSQTQNSFIAKQTSQNLEEGGVKGSRGLQSDIDFNYSFSELGQGKSTLKKQEESVEAPSGVAKEILEFKKISDEYKQKVEEGAGKAWRGEVGETQENAPTLADVFRKRKQQMVGKIEKRKMQQQEEFQKRREISSEPGVRSKEDILKQRREMMKSKVKAGSEGDEPQSPHSQLMRRLAHGEKAQVSEPQNQLSKEEMQQLSKKNYAQLPEIKQRREAQLKKEQQRERMEKAKEFDRKRKETMKKK